MNEKTPAETMIKEINNNNKTTEDCTARNISHPTKDTFYQDFYLILALGPRNGLGYCAVNNNNNNKEGYCRDIKRVSERANVTETQKISMLGSARILRKVLNI